MTRSDRIRIFCSELWRWFSVHKRTLPWRDLKIKNPGHKAYLILVSEVMLQQTQVPRVIVVYKKFIQTFPRIEDLAKATNREILIAWRGMGYNSRALRLRDAAKTIVDPHHPAPSPEGRRGAQATNRSWKFPTSMEELQSIPGIGHYTAAAIRNFAFDLPTPCLDTNIRRILHRFFIGMENADGVWRKEDRELLRLAEQVLQEACSPLPSGEGLGVRVARTTADWHAALMDFGSLVCTKKNPKWELLPPEMRSICKAYGKQKKRTRNLINKEPGRAVAGRFIPNRIFRGRIIEELRDEPGGLSLEEIGNRVALDWTMGDHRKWLSALIEKLISDQLVVADGRRYRLRE